MSCGVGRRCGLDPALLWLWHRLAAPAPTGPLAWEPPSAAGAALEMAKRQKKKKKKKKDPASPTHSSRGDADRVATSHYLCSPWECLSHSERALDPHRASTGETDNLRPKTDYIMICYVFYHVTQRSSLPKSF